MLLVEIIARYKIRIFQTDLNNQKPQTDLLNIISGLEIIVIIIARIWLGIVVQLKIRIRFRIVDLGLGLFYKVAVTQARLQAIGVVRGSGPRNRRNTNGLSGTELSNSAKD